VLALLATTCARPAPPERPSPAPPRLTESPLPPSGAAEFAIGPITETRSADGAQVFVEGTVRNVGSRASRHVLVWVNALDQSRTRLARRQVIPTPQEIPPGAEAGFIVRFPNDPAIRTFHVEAIGQ
jgi:hypothetical protein